MIGTDLSIQILYFWHRKGNVTEYYLGNLHLIINEYQYNWSTICFFRKSKDQGFFKKTITNSSLTLLYQFNFHEVVQRTHGY